MALYPWKRQSSIIVMGLIPNPGENTAMLSARLIAIVGLACMLLDWAGAAAPARAQSAVERIESRIRGRLLQPPGAPGAANPSDAKTAPELVPAGKVVSPSASATPRPYLGITADDTNDRGRGVRVLQVHADGPSARAGLQTQDLIVAAAEHRIRAVSDMAEILDLLRPGDKLVLDVMRDGKTRKIEVVLGPQPSSASAPPADETSAPPATSKPTLPDFPAVKPPQDDRARIEQLERRVEALERRIEQLEKALPR